MEYGGITSGPCDDQIADMMLFPVGRFVNIIRDDQLVGDIVITESGQSAVTFCGLIADSGLGILLGKVMYFMEGNFLIAKSFFQWDGGIIDGNRNIGNLEIYEIAWK